MAATNWLYGYFVLPESLPPERRAALDWTRANPIGAFDLLREHAHVLGIAGVVFLAAVAHEVQPSMWVLYTDYRYHWDAQTVGLTLAAVGVLSIAVGMWLVRIAVAKLGERRSLLLGLGFGAAGFALYGMAPTGAVFCAGLPIVALWGISGPSAQALMTQRMDPSEQGRLQGAISALQGIAHMIGPGLFTASFASAIGERAPWQLPGAPFLIAAGLLGSGLALAWRVAHPDRAYAPATAPRR
jgi:DHA1 family tetracycline resistance protein-like MFS transporter